VILVKQLVKQSQQYREHVPDIELLNAGVLYISKDLEIGILNDIASDLLGAPRGVMQHQNLRDLLGEDTEEYELIAHMVHSEAEYRDAVVKWEVGGIVRHVLVDTYLHQSSDGRVYGIYMVMKDMGNFALLDQTTQRVEKMATVGKLAAGIAHEIRNPLTTVKGFLQVLEQRLQNGVMSEEVQYVQMMMGEIERVNSLVAELLLLSRPHEMTWSTFAVADVIHDVCRAMEDAARQAGIQTSFHIDGEILLQADRKMIQQLLLHLIRNAIEAMEGGGSLHVEAREVQKCVEIKISDTGPGIPYYLFDRIFDAFYTTKEKGTGLGLAICQRIVTDHGGHIRVSSKGFGTIFTVSLPVRREASIHPLVHSNSKDQDSP
jgi:signal transduction histidine kinase